MTSELENVFVPFLGDFFSIAENGVEMDIESMVFVPFLGDFFSMADGLQCFIACRIVFVPFLGDFFSIKNGTAMISEPLFKFSSPFSGTFFQ